LAIALVSSAVSDSPGGTSSHYSIQFVRSNLANVENGHLVLAYIHCDVDLAFDNIPTGWTKHDEQLTTLGRDATSAYFHKFITDIDNEPALWEFGHRVASEKAAVFTCWSGVDSSTWTDAQSSFSNGDWGSHPDCADIETATDGAMIVAMMGLTESVARDATGGAPDELSLATFSHARVNDTAHAAVAYLLKASAGNQSISTWATDPYNSAYEFHTRTIALKPASDNTTTEYDLQESLSFTGQVLRDQILIR